MKNITLAMEEDIIKAGRRYAKAHNTTLNTLIRSLLVKTVVPSSRNWLTETFDLMDKTKGNSRGKRWTREDLHRV